MTIDERLDRLEERHEALAQSVEMLTAELRIFTTDIDRMRSTMDEILVFTARLLADAQAHEQRNDS